MFTAPDGTLIDIKTDLVPHHRAVLVVWPCMIGSTAMYRLPVKDFNSSGISTVQFNPRGHGRSGGQFDVEQSISDLQAYLDSLKLQDTPVWMLGHSAGASCVLRHGTTYRPAHRYILVSPVLDSIGSYRYLYDQGRQSEANLLISALSTGRDLMLPILENDEWMKPEVWHQQEYREKFDRISVKIPVGTLMQKLFIEGYNTFRDLELLAEKTSIMLPLEDRWYPMDLTNSLAEKSGIRVETISEAKDHYFTGAWKHVWRMVLESIIQDATPPC
ncbi:MAG TPA: alpha/beta fold hydrolase [Spirochaetota bacterium]|nr:alpha/beta fold hydrolase [Spirochaetota bacterium]